MPKRFSETLRFIARKVLVWITAGYVSLGCVAGPKYLKATTNMPQRAQLLATAKKLLEPPDRVDQAIAIVKEVYADKMFPLWEGQHQREPIQIFWVQGDVYWDGNPYHGLHFNSMEMYVSVFEGERISDSSFAHELAHCYADLVLHDGDGKHENELLWKNMVPAANKALKESGF